MGCWIELGSVWGHNLHSVRSSGATRLPPRAAPSCKAGVQCGPVGMTGTSGQATAALDHPRSLIRPFCLYFAQRVCVTQLPTWHLLFCCSPRIGWHVPVTPEGAEPGPREAPGLPIPRPEDPAPSWSGSRTEPPPTQKCPFLLQPGVPSGEVTECHL